VHGPSGMGKTTLTAHVLSRFERSHGAVVLTGRCHPQEIVPLKGFDEIVDQLSRVLLAMPAGDGVPLAPDRIASLLRLFPVLARVPFLGGSRTGEPTVDPVETRRRGFIAVRELFRRTARLGPIVLWIDDAQWGGADSAALLEELVREPDPPLHAVLMTFRSAGTTAGALLEACLRGRTPALDLLLGPLDVDSSRTLARAMAPAAALDDVDAVAEESGGSPFLLTQVAMLDALPARARLGDVLSQRIRALAPAARAVLATVVIAGNPTDRGIILDAAGFGEAGRRIITSLERGRLLQLVGADYSTVEPYHDRVRDTALAMMEPAARTERHRALARAFEARGGNEPDRLAEHLRAAGELERASRWAVVAARQSDEALAFAKAARLYRSAREWWPGDADRERDLRISEGNALVNAGRCGDAAIRFLEAAAGMQSVAGLELRRRAAEQYLAGGHIDEGIATLRPVLRELSLPDPCTPARAALGIGLRLAALRLRGTHFRQSSGPIDEIARIRVDACYSAAKSFTMIEPVRGVFFSVVGLQVAFRTGDPVLIGRHLMMVGGSLVSLGGRIGRWASGLMREALALAARENDPYLTGMTATGMGPAHLVAGEWRLALERSDEGVRILSERCRGVSFDCAIGRMAALRALEELGRIGEVRVRAEEMLAGARESGDRYAEVTASLYVAFAALAADDTRRARTYVDEVLRHWTRGAFNLQHLGGLQVDLFCDLYESRSTQAWQRITAAWPALESSELFRVPLPRIDAYVLRARSALAMGEPSHLAIGGKDADRLLREGRDDAMAHGTLVHAAIAARRNDQAAARRLCGDAIGRYERAGMRVHALCAERRVAEIDRAADRVTELDARIRESGVTDPSRWAGIYAPGFGRTRGEG
jgi:eukaryotic-like serine/threonine-protein kinase